MPLLIVCGYPCSGKSSRAAELAAALTARGRRVALLSEGRLDDAHSSAAAEKTIRAALRSDTARELSQQTLVIADGLNEIKGFRYELFCLARAAKTPHAVLQTAAPVEQCLAWDHARGQLYTSPERVQHLAARFEQPDNRNRWDSPLFIVTAEDPLPVDQLEAALFDRQAPPPLLSTQGQPIAETNFIHDLDRVTQQIISVRWRLVLCISEPAGGSVVVS